MQTPDKRYETLWQAPTEEDPAIPVEPADKLLLSSLKYWEVKRDLIDEHIDSNNW